MRADKRSWRRRPAARLILGGALLAATFPAWRLAFDNGSPATIDELLQLRCSAVSGAALAVPGAWPAARPDGRPLQPSSLSKNREEPAR